MKTLFVLTPLLFLMSCESDLTTPPVTEVPAENSSDTNHLFELETGADWKLKNLNGIDSYVGYYFRNTDTIRFDCGMYGFEHIDSIHPEPGSVYFEETEMNGAPGKITGTQVEGNYTWKAYIQHPTISVRHNVLRITNPTDEQEIIALFKSHSFK